MKETPETDNETKRCCISMFGEFVPADFARAIERKRDNEKELADLLAKALKATRWDSPVLCDEAMTAWESARKDSQHNA